MFKNTFQSGFLSILYSIGSKPLQIWDKKGKPPPPPPHSVAPSVRSPRRTARTHAPRSLRTPAPGRLHARLARDGVTSSAPSSPLHPQAVCRRSRPPRLCLLVTVRNGHIKRITDQDIQSSVLEIMGTNVSTNYITCPADPHKTLGIKLPFLVMIIKNLKKYFTFEVQVLDDKNVRRRFRASNYQSTTRVKPFICTMPMRLDEGWNQIQFNLSDFTRRAYGTNYIETLRVQIHANCRIRRIYFSDRLYSEEELPPEFKLFLPIQVTPPSPPTPEIGHARPLHTPSERAAHRTHAGVRQWVQGATTTHACALACRCQPPFATPPL